MMDVRQCRECGAQFSSARVPGRPRQSCYNCRRVRGGWGVFRPCHWCGGLYYGSGAAFCGYDCRGFSERGRPTFAKRTDLTAAFQAGSRPDILAAVAECPVVRATASGHWLVNSESKSRTGKAYTRNYVWGGKTETVPEYEFRVIARVSVGGVQMPAYRAMAGVILGRPVPRGAVVSHTCDDAMCINPLHLHIATDGAPSRDDVLAMLREAGVL